jgi:hypothetical protein
MPVAALPIANHENLQSTVQARYHKETVNSLDIRFLAISSRCKVVTVISIVSSHHFRPLITLAGA